MSEFVFGFFSVFQQNRLSDIWLYRFTRRCHNLVPSPAVLLPSQLPTVILYTCFHTRGFLTSQVWDEWSRSSCKQRNEHHPGLSGELCLWGLGRGCVWMRWVWQLAVCPLWTGATSAGAHEESRPGSGRLGPRSFLWLLQRGWQLLWETQSGGPLPGL